MKRLLLDAAAELRTLESRRYISDADRARIRRCAERAEKGAEERVSPPSSPAVVEVEVFGALSPAALIAAFGGLPEHALLLGAASALTVLSARYSAERPRSEAFYATNRALRELDQIRELRGANGGAGARPTDREGSGEMSEQQDPTYDRREANRQHQLADFSRRVQVVAGMVPELSQRGTLFVGLTSRLVEHFSGLLGALEGLLPPEDVDVAMAAERFLVRRFGDAAGGTLAGQTQERAAFSEGAAWARGWPLESDPGTLLARSVYKAALALFDSRLGLSDPTPQAPREPWADLGAALYGEADPRVVELRQSTDLPTAGGRRVFLPTQWLTAGENLIDRHLRPHAPPTDEQIAAASDGYVGSIMLDSGERPEAAAAHFAAGALWATVPREQPSRWPGFAAAGRPDLRRRIVGRPAPKSPGGRPDSGRLDSKLDLSFSLTTDAQLWANAFVREHGGDAGLMVAWFANAIEAGRDAGLAATAISIVDAAPTVDAAASSSPPDRIFVVASKPLREGAPLGDCRAWGPFVRVELQRESLVVLRSADGPALRLAEFVDISDRPGGVGAWLLCEDGSLWARLDLETTPRPGLAYLGGANREMAVGRAPAEESSGG